MHIKFKCSQTHIHMHWAKLSSADHIDIKNSMSDQRVTVVDNYHRYIFLEWKQPFSKAKLCVQARGTSFSNAYKNNLEALRWRI